MTNTIINELTERVRIRVVHQPDGAVHLLLPHVLLPIVLNAGESIDVEAHVVWQHPAQLMQVTISRVPR